MSTITVISILLIFLITSVINNVLNYFKKEELVQHINMLNESLKTQAENTIKNKDARERVINDTIREYDATIITLKSRLSLALYVLMDLNENWYKMLRVYNPQESIETLRLSKNIEENRYNVFGYSTQKNLEDKTGFVVSINSDEDIKLGFLIDKLNNNTIEVGLFDTYRHYKNRIDSKY